MKTFIRDSPSVSELHIMYSQQENKMHPVIDTAIFIDQNVTTTLSICPYPQVRQLKAAVPFAVCGAGQQLEVRGRRVRGRLYPWGVVEVENPEHCDFIKLRTMLM